MYYVNKYAPREKAPLCYQGKQDAYQVDWGYDQTGSPGEARTTL